MNTFAKKSAGGGSSSYDRLSDAPRNTHVAQSALRTSSPAAVYTGPSEIARQVARWLVMYLRRPGTQAQHSVHLDEQSAETHRLGELRAWIIEHLGSDLTVDRLAHQVGMSRRNFCRAFQRHTGVAPSKFVEAVRIEAAQRWLAQSDHALDEVARRSGFASADALRRSFRRCIGLTPSDYRDSMQSSVSIGPGP